MLVSKVKNPGTNLVGKKVKIVGNTSGHNYGAVGSTVKIEQWVGNNGTNVCIKAGHNYIYLNEMELLAMSVEDMKQEQKDNIKRMEELKLENEMIADRIVFMEANGVEEYDDEMFKVMQVLKKMNDATLSDLDKAKAIATIIKN